MAQPPTSSEADKPNSARTISDVQNSERGLELLITQRRMYRRARRWNYLRQFGVGVISIAVPVATLVSADAAYIGLAVAGGWTFLARVWFLGREVEWRRRAASVQEQFDVEALGLPANDAVAAAMKPEWLADHLRDDDVAEVASRERLVDWYPIEQDLPAAAVVAILQRANSVYSARLLKAHANAWVMGVSVWGVIVVIASVIDRLSFESLLVGVLLPVLPAVLDARDQYAAASDAADDRVRLADSIEARLKNLRDSELSVADLRSFQDEVYRQRRDGVMVPEFLYKRLRPGNERAMERSARELREAVLKSSQAEKVE